MIFEIKIHFESQILASLNKAAKLCKASDDDYNPGGYLILYDILNKMVAVVETFDPHDFTWEPAHAIELPGQTGYYFFTGRFWFFGCGIQFWYGLFLHVHFLKDLDFLR